MQWIVTRKKESEREKEAIIEFQLCVCVAYVVIWILWVKVLCRLIIGIRNPNTETVHNNFSWLYFIPYIHHSILYSVSLCVCVCVFLRPSIVITVDCTILFLSFGESFIWMVSAVGEYSSFFFLPLCIDCNCTIVNRSRSIPFLCVWTQVIRLPRAKEENPLGE